MNTKERANRARDRFNVGARARAWDRARIRTRVRPRARARARLRTGPEMSSDRDGEQMGVWIRQFFIVAPACATRF